MTGRTVENMTPELTPEVHKEQVNAYVAEEPHYKVYKEVLERVLQAACRASFPDAQIQARAKSISSFAEKVARRWDDKHTRPVEQFTDLCGARVIVQTTDQVKGVCEFITKNFEVCEADNKEVMLGTDRFGYRDMHYIVRLRPGRDLGIKPDERKEIGERKAEIQVRTWVQHAWADTLHDRMYKAKIKASPEMVRTGNLLAAIMEEGDRAFCRLANEIDGIIANYSAYATRDEVEQKIRIQRLILENEREVEKKPGQALVLAQLFAASGDHHAIVELLLPHQDAECPLRCELLLQLGMSLCVVHRGRPTDGEERRGDYDLGLRCLRQALAICQTKEVPFAPNLRTRHSLQARVLTGLAWALETSDPDSGEARELYRLAYEEEPENPYCLANMLDHELRFGGTKDLPCSMRPTLRAGIRTCLAHGARGIELPFSYFTAGHLLLLLGDQTSAVDSTPPVDAEANLPFDAREALACYARGIEYVLAGRNCVPTYAIEREIEKLKRLHPGSTKDNPVPERFRDAIDLLEVAEMANGRRKPVEAMTKIAAPVLIIAGGACSLNATTLAAAKPLVEGAIEDLFGTVIAGGTNQGIPGCVGDVAAAFREQGKMRSRLLGYRPENLPDDATYHPAYDETVRLGANFSALQLLQTWKDIIANGIRPQDVMVLGLGGGRLSALDYRFALALGARVGVVAGTGGQADEILANRHWMALANLLPLPSDPTTMRAFVMRPASGLGDVEEMAMEIHRRYVQENPGRLPANMQPWKKLDETYRVSNRQQALYAVKILEAEGFEIRTAKGEATILRDLQPDEVERMAKMEHGRWNVERLLDGWRLGPRDDENRRHPRLVSWLELPESIRDFDRKAVRAFPEVLAVQGLEVRRKGK